MEVENKSEIEVKVEREEPEAREGKTTAKVVPGGP